MSQVKSKGQEIVYGAKLECQGYLLPNKILTLEEQRDVFSYRSRMNNLKYNFKGNKIEEKCQCGEDMTNSHVYVCHALNNSKRKVQYSKIFDGRLYELKYVITILRKNLKKHERFTQAQDFSPLSR